MSSHDARRRLIVCVSSGPDWVHSEEDKTQWRQLVLHLFCIFYIHSKVHEYHVVSAGVHYL